jgi:GT2 family glycosyltransferase
VDLNERTAATTPVKAGIRAHVRGKFIYLGKDKFYVRGVTYGTFRPGADGNHYPEPDVVERDFARMAANGLNAVRTYTVPPRWLLDAARRHGLYVMVGLPWEQHITFLDDRRRARSIEDRVRAGVRACAGHPAVLCYVIGSEIPASIVRWYGSRRVERFLERLYHAAKSEDPGSLVTYVNYPSTEYLRLPFVDFVAFNVYLEEQQDLEAYLARLHNIAGDKPVVMAEIGLDSRTHGEECQARALDWQVRATFAAGCAGTFIFSWTDEWHRGGYDVEDWDFGLTGRDRYPKPALKSVRKAFAEVPFLKDTPWPRISVVVCTYNGERTIRDCLEGLTYLEYPDYEVIVVDDGSTDATANIASEYDLRLIRTENYGLSSARNTGMEAATGEIVAYLDDDARPDPHWLTYLAAGFLSTEHAGIGGPNIAPPDDGTIADCVANAPGGPVHVLLSDQEAEHIPGCNMAFRKSYLQAIGGFDPQFRVAGDDADICWRLRQEGWTLGFSPAAVVWHHRRSSVGAYLKQQRGYGRADAMLGRKWPEKYNAVGYLRWAGRLYGRGLPRLLGWRRERVFHGTWGTGLFQSIYQPASGRLGNLPLMPEWHLFGLAFAALSLLAFDWPPLGFCLPLLFLTFGASLLQAGLSAAHATFTGIPGFPASRLTRLKQTAITGSLHLLQPLARLFGRLGYNGTRSQKRVASFLALPRTRTSAVWSEHWRAPDAWLQSVEAALQNAGAVSLRGGDYDRWDQEVRGGRLGTARTLMTVEEHGGGKQLLRFRTWPRCSSAGAVVITLFAFLGAGAALDHAWVASGVLGAVAAALALRTLWECSVAAAGTAAAVDDLENALGSTSGAVDQGESQEA